MILRVLQEASNISNSSSFRDIDFIHRSTNQQKLATLCSVATQCFVIRAYILGRLALDCAFLSPRLMRLAEGGTAEGSTIFPSKNVVGSILSTVVKLANAKLVFKSFSSNKLAPASTTKYRTISNFWCNIAIANGDRPLLVSKGFSGGGWFFFVLACFRGTVKGQKRSLTNHRTNVKLPPRIAKCTGCLSLNGGRVHNCMSRPADQKFPLSNNESNLHCLRPFVKTEGCTDIHVSRGIQVQCRPIISIHQSISKGIGQPIACRADIIERLGTVRVGKHLPWPLYRTAAAHTNATIFALLWPPK